MLGTTVSSDCETLAIATRTAQIDKHQLCLRQNNSQHRMQHVALYHNLDYEQQHAKMTVMLALCNLAGDLQPCHSWNKWEPLTMSQQ